MPRKSKKSEVASKLKGVSIPNELFDHIEAMLDADDSETLYTDRSGKKHTAYDDQFHTLVLKETTDSLSQLMAKIAERECESLRMHVPLKKQKRFLESDAFIRLLLGGNRSGKTLTTHVEMARIMTGQKKGFRQDGELYLVGKDLKHIGAVCWKKLTGFGPFQMIRDPESNEWRPFRPNDKWDNANKHLKRPAPPLIPPRFFSPDDVEWEERKSRIPKGCSFTWFDPKGQEHHWHMTCLSSKASPPQGYDCDVGVFDEEIIGDEWFAEMIRGLTDRSGIFIWGATAQHSTQILLDLYRKAMKKSDTDVAAFVLDSMENEFMAKESMERFAKQLSHAQRRVRIHGGFAIDNIRVYPEFDIDGAHGIDAHPIPEDWTIYAAIDPGRQLLAVEFIAIPPETVPLEKRFIELFAEIYLERGTAGKFGRAMKRVLGDRVAEAFIIDHRMGRQGQLTSGESVEWHYSQELKRQKIRSRRTGYGFQWGSTDIQGRENSLQRWLRIRGSTGEPWLKVHRGKCPGFVEEMPIQLYKQDKSANGKSKRVDRDNHAVTCVEYLAAAKLKWVAPEKAKPRASPILKLKAAMDAFFAKSEAQEGGITIGPRGDKRQRGGKRKVRQPHGTRN